MTLRKSAPGSDCGWPESGYVNFRGLMGAMVPWPVVAEFHRDRLDEAETKFKRAMQILPDRSLPRNALAQVKALRAR